jgi:hypothetical protein
MKDNLLALAGEAAGGAFGYFGFFWIAEQGFYALVLPGGLLGLGAGVFKNRSVGVAVVCGLAAIALGLFTEYRFAPCEDDDSLVYFLAHIPDLEPITLIMIAVGGLIGFWVPFQRTERTRSSGN